jgi:hypothetical protein
MITTLAPSSTDHIVGGFPYVGSVKTIRHDGSAMPSVKLNLCSRLYSDVDEMRNQLTQNSHAFYTYDEDQVSIFKYQFLRKGFRIFFSYGYSLILKFIENISE